MIQNPPILILGLSVLLGIVHVFLQAMTATRDTGLKWNMGPRDEKRDVGMLAGRMERAAANFRETYPLFAVAMIAAYLGGQVDTMVIASGWVYLAARALYIPLYGMGVTGARSLVWGVSFSSIVVIMAAVLI